MLAVEAPSSRRVRSGPHRGVISVRREWVSHVTGRVAKHDGLTCTFALRGTAAAALLLDRSQVVV